MKFTSRPKRRGGLQSPEWVGQCPRRMFLGFHYPDYDQAPQYARLVKAGKARPILADFDARTWARELKKARVQAACFYNKCHRGNAYYPSRTPGAHVHSALKTKGDIFGQLCEACLSADIVPLALYEFSDGRIATDHPHWCHRTYLTAEERARLINDKQVKSQLDLTDGEQGSRISGPCLNGPYGEYAIEQARETVKNYPIEGYWVDFLGLFTFGKWVCPYCAPRFKADLGFEFRGIENMNRRQRMEYRHWHYAQNAAYIEKMRRAIEDVRPGLVFVHNFHGGYARTGLQTWEMAGKLTSYLTGDLFTMRAGQLPVEWKLRGYAAASRMKPAEALLDCAVCVGAEGHAPKALDSYRAELWTARALNIAPAVSCMSDITGKHDPYIFALAGKVFEDQAAYEPWLTDMQPEYKVGILRSSHTLEYGGNDDDIRAGETDTPADAHRHESEFQGWCQALIQGHFLWDVLHDHLLTEEYLRRFKVVILPHAVCLSDSQCSALTNFMKNGGRVIATGETSRRDQNGTLRRKLALADQLGIRRFAKWQPAYDRLLVTDRNLRPRDPWVAPFLAYSMGQAQVYPAPAAVILGEIQTSNAVPLVSALTSAGAPGLLTCQYGRGRSIYFAGLPGMQYRMFGVDNLRVVMTAVINRLYARNAPVTLDAPGCVGLYAHRQSGRNQLVVNLVNWMPGCSRTAGSLPTGMGADASRNLRFDEVARMPLISEAVLRFRCTRGKSLRRVYLAPTRRKLGMRREGDDVFVTIPPFKVHAMIVAEPG